MAAKGSSHSQALLRYLRGFRAFLAASKRASGLGFRVLRFRVLCRVQGLGVQGMFRARAWASGVSDHGW